jgi:hypothetical protein
MAPRLSYWASGGNWTSLTDRADRWICPLCPLQTGRACVKKNLLFQIYFTIQLLFIYVN